MGKSMTIGKLATAAGISVETIRFYQRQGLIIQPEKPLNGFRQYHSETIAQLKFIINAKGLGFTLNEIRSLDNLSAGCELFHNLANTKLESIKDEINNLQSIENKLITIVESCSPHCKEDNCSIIETMHS
jgi:MerR family mercuric resistance operon transcriptional regulator